MLKVMGWYLLRGAQCFDVVADASYIARSQFKRACGGIVDHVLGFTRPAQGKGDALEQAWEREPGDQDGQHNPADEEPK
jgi:hypothetical protein